MTVGPGASAAIDRVLTDVRAFLDRVEPADLAAEMAAGALVVDTRPLEQRSLAGELPGAIVIDRNVLEWRLDPSCPHRCPQATDRERKVIVVCNEGYSSSLAARSLQLIGLKRATDLVGGFQAWRAFTADRRGHWDAVYASRSPLEMSWFEARPGLSIELISSTLATPDASIVDVGGGSSNLASELWRLGYRDLTVVDVSQAALDSSRARQGRAAPGVAWVAADVLAWTPPRRYTIWHDRALFHFLVDDADCQRYLSVLRNALAPGGYAIVATFDAHGPESCSGLPVTRYSPMELAEALGSGFTPVTQRSSNHLTPNGATQPFSWVVMRRQDP